MERPYTGGGLYSEFDDDIDDLDWRGQDMFWSMNANNNKEIVEEHDNSMEVQQQKEHEEQHPTSSSLARDPEEERGEEEQQEEYKEICGTKEEMQQQMDHGEESDEGSTRNCFPDDFRQVICLCLPVSA
jgi:hypothetical protein